MAQPREPSSLLSTLRQEFVPSLLRSSDPEQFPELLSRLANCLGADGAVLWRVEEDQILPQATFGALRADWAAAHSRVAERRASSGRGESRALSGRGRRAAPGAGGGDPHPRP